MIQQLEIIGLINWWNTTSSYILKLSKDWCQIKEGEIHIYILYIKNNITTFKSKTLELIQSITIDRILSIVTFHSQVVNQLFRKVTPSADLENDRRRTKY